MPAAIPTVRVFALYPFIFLLSLPPAAAEAILGVLGDLLAFGVSTPVFVTCNF